MDSTADIQAVVPDLGQGSGVKINVAKDQTQQFALLYGDHSASDKVFSEVAIVAVEIAAILTIMMVMLEVKKWYNLATARGKNES